MLKQSCKRMSGLQERLYAQDRWSVLLIFQAMDAAGKDGTIKHVMSGVNPQGCDVHAFKAPSTEELDHDFLWRTTRRLPRRGHIGIFNRSYYEETLVVRVHQNILAKQQLPSELVTKNIWRERFEDINAYERYLARQGVLVRKFFLHVSKDEQRKRFLERLDKPEKHWKFSPADVGERSHFAAYMAAYEDMIRHTSTEWAPWYVDSGRSQVVHAPGRLCGDHRRHSVARSAFSRGRSRRCAPSSSASRTPLVAEQAPRDARRATKVKKK